MIPVVAFIAAAAGVRSAQGAFSPTQPGPESTATAHRLDRASSGLARPQRWAPAAANESGPHIVLASQGGSGPARGGAVSSQPPDFSRHFRPAVPADRQLGRRSAAARATPGGTLLVKDPAVGIRSDGPGNEPSIAINPANPKQIAMLSFANGWGADAPFWYSSDGGQTWSEPFSVPAPPGAPGGGPNDQAPDWGRGGALFSTFLSCRPGDKCRVYAGGTTDPTSAGAWNWTSSGGNVTDVESAAALDGADQPWLLVNPDPSNTANDIVYTAYDDFNNGVCRVNATAGFTQGTLPPVFSRDHQVGVFGTNGNPGLRLANDRRSGAIYAVHQKPTGLNGDGSLINHYILNRSLDGGQTWILNGNANGIEVAAASSDQNDSNRFQGKFGSVNTLLGGVDHAAVDPTTGDVYVVFGDRDDADPNLSNRLGIVRLADDGSGNLAADTEHFVGITGTEPVQAALPSVAVADNGTVGVLYTTFDGFSATKNPADGQFYPIFTAHFAQSSDKGVTWKDQVLLTFLSTNTADGSAGDGQRELGDYCQVKAVGRKFYGVFAGNGASLGQSQASIDPIFFASFAGGPQIQVNGTNLQFGTLAPGQTADQTVQVFNTGTDDLHVLSVPRTSGSAEFSLLPHPTIPTTIAPGAHVDYTVRFAPTGAAGPRSATFSINSDDPDTPTVGISAAGALGSPKIQVNNTDLQFGTLVPGQTADQVVQVFNTGTADLTVSGFPRITGSSEFGVLSNPTIPTIIQPGSHVDYTVRFTPTGAAGPRSATFHITSDDPVTPLVGVSAAGTLGMPAIQVNGTNLQFGTLAPGQTADQVVQVFNTGTADLHVSGFPRTTGSTDFSVLPNPTIPTTIQPGAHVDYTIRFAPTGAAGARAATFSINSDDPNTPAVQVSASGTLGTPKIDTVPAPAGTLAFGDVKIGASKTLIIQVLSEGTAPLTITAVNFGGGTNPDFTLAAPGLPLTLAVGASANIPVTLTPTGAFGSRTGSVVIASDDPGGAVTVQLTGNVPPPVITTTPAAHPNGVLDFGSVPTGSSKTLDLLIGNTGGSDLTVAAISTATVTGSGFSSINPAIPAKVKAGDSVTVHVTYAPTTFGPSTGTVTIISNSGGVAGTTTVVDLAGSAPASVISTTPPAGGTLDFGNVCLGSNKTLDVSITDRSASPLAVSAVNISGTGYTLSGPTTPFVVASGATTVVHVTVTPQGAFGTKTGQLTITSDDPVSSPITINLTGNVPAPKISAQGVPVDFGKVSLSDPSQHQKSFDITNMGACDLHITGINFAPSTSEFTVSETASGGNPLTVAPGENISIHVTFTPTSAGLKTAILAITSDDPVTPILNVSVSGDSQTAGLSDLAVPTGIAFPATVIQPDGGTATENSPAISNTGSGLLKITSITITGANAADFSLAGLPGLPIVLNPGDTLGDGDFRVRFLPQAMARTRSASLVLSVVDPISGASLGNATVPLAGEAVRPGARILVTSSGTPVPQVTEIVLQRLGEEGFHTLKDLHKVSLTTINLAAPQSTLVFHTEIGGGAPPPRPKFLRPGTYRWQVTIKSGGHLLHRHVPFSLGEATFADVKAEF